MENNLILQRRKKTYFTRIDSVPSPLVFSEVRRIRLEQVDFMGYTWFGRYSELMGGACTELCRQCGLSYEKYHAARLLSAVVQFHVDYFLPLTLDEEVTVKAFMIWTEGARLNLEYELFKQNGRTAATGYTVQMFINEIDREALFVSPDILENMRKKWREGKFKHLQ